MQDPKDPTGPTGQEQAGELPADDLGKISGGDGLSSLIAVAQLKSNIANQDALDGANTAK